MSKFDLSITLAHSFEKASADLINAIREAVDSFHANQPKGWEAWEVWKTPRPWVERVLPNLLSYHTGIQNALRDCHAGNITSLVLSAASYASISKDIDLDMAWMVQEHRIAVEEAIKQVVLLADQIQHLGQLS